MSEYRRMLVPGGTYFFTVVTRGRAPLFREPGNVARLRAAFRYAKARRPFRLVAVCVLPDHLHCVWALGPTDHDLPERWKMLKTYFTRALGASGEARLPRSPWQPRYREHAIRDEDDLARHVDYVHFNPVKHGLVHRAVDWPYSSLPRFVDHGYYERGWGLTEPARIGGLDLE